MTALPHLRDSSRSPCPTCPTDRSRSLPPKGGISAYAAVVTERVCWHSPLPLPPLKPILTPRLPPPERGARVRSVGVRRVRGVVSRGRGGGAGSIPCIESLAQGGNLALRGGERVSRPLPDRLDARCIGSKELSKRARRSFEVRGEIGGVHHDDHSLRLIG